MGRKKKFIDKKESTTFHVVHRSQQDKAAEGEEAPSEFVLIPSVPRKDKSAGRQGGDDDPTHRAGEKSKRRLFDGRDHINALGLPNDGYDYDQHLKSIGGGTFVSRTGRVERDADGGKAGARVNNVVIPEEALPSEETLDRQLEAITISEKVMDSDMRRALAGGLEGVTEGFDELEEAGANWLDDDFVVQATGAGDDDGDFDFDAHVARLMEASAKETGLRARTAEDNLDTKRLARVKRLEDEDEEEGSDASGEFDESLLEGVNLGGLEAAGGAAGEEGDGSGKQDRALVDAQFEAVLAEYDSDEWGELEEDDDRVKGKWDVEEHEYANECMDEFLVSKKDAVYVEGLKRAPTRQQDSDAKADTSLASVADGGNPGGSPRATVAASDGTREGGVVSGNGTEQKTLSEAGDRAEKSAVGGVSAPVSGGPRLGRLKGLRETSDGGEREDSHEDEEREPQEEADVLEELGRHNEYLRVKEKEDWDCESVVSTYSNLDNHPRLIGRDRKSGSRRRPRGNSSVSSAGVSSAAGGVGGAGDEADDREVEQVVLSKKTGLPLGVLPERTTNERDMVSLTAGKNLGEKRDMYETFEEKRQRKSLLKQEKKTKRLQKKGVKQAFTNERKVVTNALANPEAPQNRSIFSYS